MLFVISYLLLVTVEGENVQFLNIKIENNESFFKERMSEMVKMGYRKAVDQKKSAEFNPKFERDK